MVAESRNTDAEKRDLIQALKQKPSLWNTSLAIYKDKELELSDSQMLLQQFIVPYLVAIVYLSTFAQYSDLVNKLNWLFKWHSWSTKQHFIWVITFNMALKLTTAKCYTKINLLAWITENRNNGLGILPSLVRLRSSSVQVELSQRTRCDRRRAFWSHFCAQIHPK